MFEIIKAGGWIMLPIVACSVLAVGILLERFWMLRNERVLPPRLLGQIWEWIRNDELDQTRVEAIYGSSPLGKILAAGLNNRHHSREIMKESIEDTGRHVAHELERFIDSLNTIAAVTPLLGLLGTVLGMIKVFTVITTSGVGSPGELAGGISQALITTAAGLSVAIPALIFHRIFRAKVESLVVGMEEESLKLIDSLHGELDKKG